MVFLENYYEILILAHLFLTFVLVGSLTHNLLVVAGYLRGKFGRMKLELKYAKYSFWSYLIIYIVGALAYPAFRVYIRGHFDPNLPWATGLFEVKEHWGSIGLALLSFYYLLRKNFKPNEEKEKLLLYAGLCLLINIIVWYKVVVGCYLSLLKGSW